MIYVTREQIAQVKYYLELAMQGNYVLFDSETLRKVITDPDLQFRTREELDSEYSVESHIEKMMTLKSLMQKRTYLERLPHDTYRAVVRAYVNIVETTLHEARNVKH